MGSEESRDGVKQSEEGDEDAVPAEFAEYSPDQAKSAGSTSRASRMSTGGKMSKQQNAPPDSVGSREGNGAGRPGTNTLGEPLCRFAFNHKHIANKANRLTFDGGECIFCGRLQEDNGQILGHIIHFGTINIHQLCLLTASGTKQKDEGEGNAELEDFTSKAVILEFSRGSRLTCVFCKKRGATVGCVNKQCKVGFHLPCGRENETFHKFTGTFPSWCKDHIPEPAPAFVEETGRCKNKIVAYTTCQICMTNRIPMTAKPGKVVRTSCCPKRKFRYYCHDCIQNCVSNSGALSQCPFKCASQPSEESLFQIQIKEAGIFIPDRDALWEKDGNFEELAKRQEYCILAGDCKCPQGALFKEDVAKDEAHPWELLDYCDMCGSVTIHRGCAGKPWSDLEAFERESGDEIPWVCFTCNDTQYNSQSSQQNRPASNILEDWSQDPAPDEAVEREAEENCDEDNVSFELRLNISSVSTDTAFQFPMLSHTPTPKKTPQKKNTVGTDEKSLPPSAKKRAEKGKVPVFCSPVTEDKVGVATSAVTRAENIDGLRKTRKRRADPDSAEDEKRMRKRTRTSKVAVKSECSSQPNPVSPAGENKPAAVKKQSSMPTPTKTNRPTEMKREVKQQENAASADNLVEECETIHLSSDDETDDPTSSQKWLKSPTRSQASPKKSPMHRARKIVPLPGQLKMEQFFRKKD